MSVFVAFRWKVSDGSCIMLELPPGFDINNDVFDGPYTYTTGCSDDGSVITGYYSVDGNDTFPCVWVNGAFVALTSTTVDVTNAIAVQCSADGSIVVGIADRPTSVIYWTTRTNGVLLPPAPGSGPNAYSYAYYYDWNGPMMSRDGRVVAGTSMDPDSGIWTNVVWTNGVASNWGNTRPPPSGPLRLMTHCSGDGSTMTTGYTTQPTSVPGFFRTQVFYPLSGNNFPGYYVGYVFGPSDDGTRIFGIGLDAYGITRPCYWDNLTSVTGSADFGNGLQNTYGTIHILPTSSAGCNIETYALSGTGAAGSAYTMVDHAIRWVNGVFTDLQPDPPRTNWFVGRGMGCNFDGTLTCGEAAFSTPDLNGNTTAAYWDAAGTLHRLYFPVTASNGYAYGMSRDGTIIHGDGGVDASTSTAVWEFIGAPHGGVGDAWSDPSYVNFDDYSVRATFINPDNSWMTLGDNGELPTGDSPISFLTSQWSDDPWSFTYAYGQWGSQDSWNIEWGGTDPTTGSPYPDDPTFDTDCVNVIIVVPEFNKLAIDNLVVEDNLNIDDVFSIIYRWRSREFYQMAPISLGACQISLDPEVILPPPPNTPLLNAADPLTVLPPGVNAIFRLYVGPESKILYFTKVLDQPRMIFRLPSGLKAFNWQFEIVSRVPVHSVELASTMRELQQV